LSGQIILIQQPPTYCQYTSGNCDQSFEGVPTSDALFLYPNEPELIAKTIEESIRVIRKDHPELNVRSWKDLGIGGQIIFCRICQSLRFSRVAVTDVTHLNFNVLFEIGYALGLGIPVFPIRDTTFITDNKDFNELGLLDTLGYVDFTNHIDLATKLPKVLNEGKFPALQQYQLDQDQPLFVVKSPIVTDGVIKLMSSIKKSGLRFRSFDSKETSRLSIHDAWKSIQTSLGFVAHLISTGRRGAKAHNARCAFMAGLAMASGKYVLMLQEGKEIHPIDYRDVVQSYTDAGEVQKLIGAFVQPLYEAFQSKRFVPITLPLRPLETLDFGDIAAENEINALRSYFVPTAQYNEVRRGHARLVVGRKGAGKTAIFYGVRNAYWTSQDQIVLDLKPEGHQFTKLRETVLQPLSQGMQEHILTAFWHYLLLMELAHKIVETDRHYAYRVPDRAVLYDDIKRLHDNDTEPEQGDFSERLLALVDRITLRQGTSPMGSGSAQVTESIYSTDIKLLYETLSAYLKSKGGVWLLFDNLDKGWPVNGALPEDILVLRCLLEATRKLQRQFARNDVDFRAVVFIRNDIYEHLLAATPDKGKDTAVALDWTDPEAFQEIVHRRIMTSTGHQEPFEQLWPLFFDTHVRGEESFSYILRSTLMRPRDLLRFLRRSVNVAVNRGHNKVTESDILQAQKVYSEDQLQEVSFELRDVSPNYPDVLYTFIGSETVLSDDGLRSKLEAAKIRDSDTASIIELLLWFGFLGVLGASSDERYAYQFQYGVGRMLHEAHLPIRYVIHPAFRQALGCNEI
jgi:hypothetical protein